MSILRHTCKVLLAIAISSGLFYLAAVAAFAAPALPLHAKVISSDPGIGSTVAQMPAKVTVTAAENMNPDPNKSNLFVYGPGTDATDTLISQGNALVSFSNPKQMSVNITPNNGHIDGVYVVMWKTVSADDGDPAAGSFTFTVNTKGTTTPPSTTRPAAPVSSTSSGTSIWVPIAAALVALIIGLGAGFGLGRRVQGAAASSFRTMRNQMEREREQEESGKRS